MAKKGGPNTGELKGCIAKKIKAGKNFREAQVQCALTKKVKAGLVEGTQEFVQSVVSKKATPKKKK